MIAIICEWCGDLSVGPSGDIAVASIESNAQQRVIRRLLTNAGDYIWHTDYGAGLGSYVGRTYSPSSIEATILNQLQLEPVVDSIPVPTVQINQSIAGSFSSISVTVQYQIAGTPTADFVIMNIGA